MGRGAGTGFFQTARWRPDRSTGRETGLESNQHFSRQEDFSNKTQHDKTMLMVLNAKKDVRGEARALPPEGLGLGRRQGWGPLARRAAVTSTEAHTDPSAAVRLWAWPPGSARPAPTRPPRRRSRCPLAPVQRQSGGCRPRRGGRHCSFHFPAHRNLLPCKRPLPSPTAQRCRPEAASCFGKPN